MPATTAALEDVHGPAVFPLLADPVGYRACEVDLLDHDQQRAYWIGLFETHFPKLLMSAEEELRLDGLDSSEAEERLAEAQRTFDEYLTAIRNEPAAFGPLDIIEICKRRELAIHSVGILDAYRTTKKRENEVALKVLPALLEELDRASDEERPHQVIRGIFAGNIFDLGAVKTADLFAGGQSVDFHAVRAQLRDRPWLFDGLDAWIERIRSGRTYRKAIVFVDNAGCDIVLGMIPFVRELLREGTQVVMTANTLPALNDVTIEELGELMGIVSSMDERIAEALRDGQLSMVASGNGLPLIDLAKISEELADAAGDADLVVLEGMGRSVESNFSAAFTCDAVKIAMVKDEGVAEAIGGEIYDLVMRYDVVESDATTEIPG